jgi:Mce-associated membrane protein
MEGDAGASRLNPAGQAGTEVPVAAPDTTERGVSRLRGRGPIAVCAVLVLLAAGVATGGYLALRSHHESQAVARDDAAATEAAKDCVAATQAPDVDALPAAQQKISECSTDVFATQAAVYSGVLMQGYQAANVHIQLAEMRTAVERNNDDGSVDLLVALRVKVDNIAAQGQQYGYRLRVKMARDDGRYKIAKLDQVAG